MSNDFSMAKYPMATKALQEQDTLFEFGLFTYTQKNLKEEQKNIAAIIDKDAVGPAEQKDAMITMFILQSTAPYLLKRPSRLEYDYNKAVQDLVNEMNTDTVNTKPSVAMAQINMAVFILSTETEMKDTILQMNFAEVSAARKELTEMGVYFDIAKNTAQSPALSARLDDCIRQSNQQLDLRLHELSPKSPQLKKLKR